MRRTFSVLLITMLLLAIMSCTGGSNAVVPMPPAGQNQPPPWDIPWDYWGVASFDAELRMSGQNENSGWAKTWGGSDYDAGYGVAVDGSGNTYVAGWFQGIVDFDPGPSEDWHTSNGYDVFLSKFDSSGTFFWARTWGSGQAQGYAIATDGSGNVYVTGSFRDTVDFDPGDGVDNHASNGEEDVFLSKFDPSGNFLWARTWGGNSHEFGGYGVITDASGKVYVVGTFYGTTDFDPGSGVDNHTSNGESDVFLSKFNSSGTFLWARTWGGNSYDQSLGVATDGSDKIYVTGYFFGATDFDPGSDTDLHTSNGDTDAFLSKFNPSGTFLWARTWGGSGGSADSGYAVTADTSDNVYVTGTFQETADFDPGDGEDWHTSNGIEIDAFLSKFDSSGTFLWARTWGGSDWESGLGITVDGSGSVYIAGAFRGTVDFDPGDGVDNYASNGNQDVFLSTFDSYGTFLWVRTGGGSGYDYGNDVSVDGSGNVYVTGAFEGTVDFDPGSGVDNHTSNGAGDVFLSTE